MNLHLINIHFGMKKRILPLLGIALCLSLISASKGVAGVNINLVVVNPSATETKKVPVKYYLPKELASQDVINTSGLNLDYDIDKGAYYVHGDLELTPKESKTVKVEVHDVWRVTSEEVDVLKKTIDQNLQDLKNTPYYQTAELLRNHIFEQLDYILIQQGSYSDNVERRMEEYRAHLSVLDDIRKNAYSSEYLKSAPAQADEAKTVKFIIEAKNPSETQTKTVKQKHYLPIEVRSEHLVESQGFEVRFDEKKKQSYLSKEEEFKPSETKRYEIIIKDIWNISSVGIDALQKRAETAFEKIKGTEYESGAKFLLESITQNLQLITDSQQDKQDMKRYVGVYRENKKRYEAAQEDVIKLEMLLAKVQAKRLEELEKSKVKNVLQKVQALRGIMAISQALFGQKPSPKNVWMVIWSILIFVALFTTIHFFTWWRKSQVMGEDLALKAKKDAKPPPKTP